jgi:hypothetical protein
MADEVSYRHRLAIAEAAYKPTRPTTTGSDEEMIMEPDKTDPEAQLRASLNVVSQLRRNAALPAPTGGEPTGKRKAGRSKGREGDPKEASCRSAMPVANVNHTSAVRQACGAERMSLRRKLAEVRRRIGYIQKRGYNERCHYNYVAAADIAGTIGDILAELGVVIIPRLESITCETSAPGRGDSVRIARVIMAYTFTDVDSGEEVTARVAGEGLDAGDKASYKAMTGALKYALLQSFLLATGDDPEDERADAHAACGAGGPITAEQVAQLQALIEQTATDLERVLAYYKIAALGEMTETTWRRALGVLQRKLGKQGQGDGVHAEN